MLRRARQYGPVLLVPFAWAFAIAVNLDLAGVQAAVIAHLVMDACLLAFVITGWSEMTEGALRIWRSIIAVGLVITLAGTVGLLLTPVSWALTWISLVGWTLLPAGGLIYTGYLGAAGPRVYYVGGTISVVGGIAYAVTSFLPVSTEVAILALVLVGIGQTAGIVNAAYRS